MPDVNQQFAGALAAQRLGQLAAAETIYREILSADPNHVPSLTNLAVLEIHRGQHAVALELLDRSLAIDPNQPQGLGHRGAVRCHIGRFPEALVDLDRAVALRPNDAHAHTNRALALSELLRHADALAACDHALALKPDSVEALIVRGRILVDLNQPESALAACDRALQLGADSAEAYNARGRALYELTRWDEALASFRSAIERRPDFAEVHGNCGIALFWLGRPDEALASFDRAIALQPDRAETIRDRGLTFMALRRYDRALPDLTRAHALKPHLNLLGGYILHARMHLCDWDGFERESQALLAALDRDETLVEPFALLALPASPAQQQRAAERYAGWWIPAITAQPREFPRHDHGRIRLGYFSADLRNHAQGTLISGLIERHDRAAFEVYGYYYGPDDRSDLAQQLEQAFDRFVNVRARSDAEIAELARADEIDIAIDLNGYTGHSRTALFAHRAAPVQVNYLGYPGTLGMNFIDYLIADSVVIPDRNRQHYTENIVRLPNSYQVNDDKRVIAESTPTRAEAGLPPDGFVFCCFNASYKITPQVFDVWTRLLSRLEGSVLWLLDSNDIATANLRHEAAKRGVDPDRIIFAPGIENVSHLARQRLANLFLDTFYVGAHTTASDALWAGLPLLTCPGETFASRVAASLLTAVGLPDLIAASHAEYETLAFELATRPDRLGEIRERLARSIPVCPLFDTARFTRAIERAYREMFRRHHEGLPPEHFDIES